MTTDQNDPDGLNWRIAKAVQPEIYKALNHVSKLDHNHVRDMNVDRNRGRGTWWWAVKVADAVIAALPELPDNDAIARAGAWDRLVGAHECPTSWTTLVNGSMHLDPVDHDCPLDHLDSDDEPEHGNPFGSPRYWLGWTSKYTRDGYGE